jgi:glycosyltransferase involved in cell wall biosynthesis
MSDRSPRVSIVTPSFNQGPFLAETIESVLAQEGDFFIDYIISDGGSTDDSVRVIEKYDELLKSGRWPIKCRGIDYRWWSRKDDGQADAVNQGMAAARGEIIGWVNSDDIFEPGALGEACAFFVAHPEIDLIYGRGAHIAEDGGFLEWYPTEPFDSKRLLQTCYICQPAAFFRRLVVERLGPLNVQLHYCLDYEYWLRAAEAVSIAYLEKHLASVRLYQETKTLSNRVGAYGEAIAVLKERFNHVPGEWVYGWSKAKLNERAAGGGPGHKSGFPPALIWLTLTEYVRINKRLPLREFLAWLRPRASI